MAFNSTLFVFSLALKLYCLLWTDMPCYLQYTVLLFQGYHDAVVLQLIAEIRRGIEKHLLLVQYLLLLTAIVTISTVLVLFLGTDNIHSLRKRGEISFTNPKYHLKLNRSSFLLKTSALISKQFN